MPTAKNVCGAMFRHLHQGLDNREVAKDGFPIKVLVMKKLTAERARELLSYNPETGELRRKTGRSGVRGVIAGGIAYNGYRLVTIDGKSWYAHRVIYLIMTGEWPPDQMDHINRVRDDNRWENLRPVTALENSQNKGPPSTCQYKRWGA